MFQRYEKPKVVMFVKSALEADHASERRFSKIIRPSTKQSSSLLAYPPCCSSAAVHAFHGRKVRL